MPVVDQATDSAAEWTGCVLVEMMVFDWATDCAALCIAFVQHESKAGVGTGCKGGLR